MKPNRQHEHILSILRDGQWHCGSEWLSMIKDDRKRLSELNNGYMKDRGYEIIGKKCTGVCGKNHSSGLFMRKAVKINTPEITEKVFSDYFDTIPVKV